MLKIPPVFLRFLPMLYTKTIGAVSITPEVKYRIKVPGIFANKADW
jgi:hypothetical protein